MYQNYKSKVLLLLMKVNKETNNEGKSNADYKLSCEKNDVHIILIIRKS